MAKVDLMYDAYGPSPSDVDMKFRIIEEKFKAMEGSGAFGLDAADMCLVPGVKIMAKFKVLTFEKYKGLPILRPTSGLSVEKWLHTLMTKS